MENFLLRINNLEIEIVDGQFIYLEDPTRVSMIYWDDIKNKKDILKTISEIEDLLFVLCNLIH